MTEDNLTEVFEKFGLIKSVKVIRDDNGESRGFGYVSYMAPQDAQQAVISANNTCILKNNIMVSFARNKRRFFKKGPHAHQQQNTYHNQQEQQQAQQAQEEVAAAQPAAAGVEPITEEERTAIGEFLFKIGYEQFKDETVSGKVTGMILDSLSPAELRVLSKNANQAKNKIIEAKNFLDTNQK